MPKNKTHSGAKKRLRVTGTGKVVHERVGRQHKFEERSRRAVRRLAGSVEVAGADAKKARRLLGR